MVSMANLNIPERAVRQQVANAIHAVVSELMDGRNFYLALYDEEREQMQGHGGWRGGSVAFCGAAGA